MTRLEFIENITSWWDLIDFCREYDCYVCEDVYDDEARDDYINEDLVDLARDLTWRDLRDHLDELDTGYEFWLLRYGEWTGLDDRDFRDMKESALEWADDNDVFDTEDDEEDEFEETEPFEPDPDFQQEQDEETDPEDESPIEDEDFPISVFFGSSVASLAAIDAKGEAEYESAQQELSGFFKQLGF